MHVHMYVCVCICVCICVYPQSKKEDEGLHASCLFVCAQLVFSTITQFRTPRLGKGATHSRLGLPTYVDLIN